MVFPPVSQRFAAGAGTGRKNTIWKYYTLFSHLIQQKWTNFLFSRNILTGGRCAGWRQ